MQRILSYEKMAVCVVAHIRKNFLKGSDADKDFGGEVGAYILR